MRISNVLAGFTLGEADVLRKAMGKKNAEVMADDARQVRRRREEARGSTRRRPAHIFDLMEHFAGYGFNKSHSTAYAFLAYQTAYLKANYPWHFAAALLTIEAQNTDKLALYLGECRERGDSGAAAGHQREPAALHRRAGQGRPLRPDRDQERRRGRDRVAARGPRRSRAASRRSSALCEDLDLRLVNKRVFESLVKAGAFDSLGAGRPRYASLPPSALRPRLLAADRCRLRARRAPAARQERRPGAAVRRVRRRRAAAGSAGPAAARAAAGRRRRGPRPSSWPSRRKRSASTGAAIRSIGTPAS